MDAIKGTVTEIYNDLSKSTTGNTIAEVCLLNAHFYIYDIVNFTFFLASLHNAEYSIDFFFSYNQIIVIVRY